MEAQTRICGSKGLLTFLLASTLIFSGRREAAAHTCPADATATGVGLTVAALFTNGVPVGSGSVAPCEPLLIRMAVVYIAIDPVTGGRNAAFQDGQMLLATGTNPPVDVTPMGGIPLIGGDGTPGCDGTNFFRSDFLPYTVTEADAQAGRVQIFADYINGNAHLTTNDLLGVVSGTQAFEVRVRPGVMCILSNVSSSVCPGGSASFCVTATNGTGPYRIVWTGPAGFAVTNENTTNSCITIPNAQAANAGTYTATVTDFYGCVATCDATLTLNPNPICSISPPLAELCFGTNCQTFVVTPSSGTAPYTIVCSGPGLPPITNVVSGPISFQACATNLGTNVYICTITDSNGCMSSCSATLVVNPNPTCSISPPNAELCFGPQNCASFTVTPANGEAPYTIVWSGPGGPIATNVTTTNATFSVCATNIGTNVYTAAIRDNNGCTGSCTATLIVNPNPTCSISPPNAELCFGPQNCVDFVVTPANGEAPYTIVWSRLGVPIATNITTTNATFSVCATNIGTNVYTATIRDNNNCTGSCTATLIVNPNPTCSISPPNSELCFGPQNCVDFVVTPANGEAPYTIVWSGTGGPIATNVTTTNATFRVCATNIGTNVYTATIRDNNNCVGTCNATLIVNPNPTCSISPPNAELCFGPQNCVNFVVTPANGEAPYTIVWSRLGIPIATNVTTTNATFTVCATNIGTNVYTATIRDNNNCTGTCTATLIVNPNPTCSISPPNAELCFGPQNCVDFVVTPANGEAPYTIVWSRLGVPIATNVTTTNATFSVCATNVGTNVYTATIRDNNNCTGSCTAILVVNPNPTCSISPPTGELCFGPQNCVNFVVTPANGEAPYTIVWNGPGGPIATNVTTTNATFSVCATAIGTNTYTATIRDNNGCVGSCNATVIVNPNPTCSITPPNAELCFGPQNCVNFVVTPASGEAPYTIVWSRLGVPIATNVTTTNATFTVCATNVGTNVYTATIRDNNNCTGTCTATLIVNPNPTCSISPPNTELCFGPQNCTDFVVTPANGEAPYTIVWSRLGVPISTNVTTTNATFRVCATNIGTNVYTATIRDNNNCAGSCTATLVVTPNPTCSITPPNAELCFGPQNCVDFVVTPANGEAPYTIVWSRLGLPIATNITTTNATFRVCATTIGTNVYTATIRDNNGCTGSCSATVVVNPNPVCSITPPSAELCPGPANCVDYVVTPAGGEAPYTIIWSGTGGPIATNITTTNATFSVCATAMGTRIFTATIIDNNGCTGTCSATNIVNPPPVCSIAPRSAELCLGPENCINYVVTPASGEAPYTIVWSGPSGPIATNVTTTNATFTVCATALGTRVFTATITDNNGCVGTCSATNIVNPNPACSITPPLATICPDTCVDLVVTPSMGEAPYRVILSGPSGPIRTNTTSTSTTFQVCPIASGSTAYTATIIDNNGCRGVCNAIVVVRDDINPDLIVTKICPVPGPAPGGTFIFSGFVSNSGNVVVSNIMVVNDRPTANTVLTNIPFLNPGAAAFFTNSYTVPVNTCSVSDTITASGRDICGQLVQATSGRVTCPLTVTPAIDVAKSCPPGPVQPGGVLTITGTVTNRGNITLTNVVVSNIVASLSQRVYGPATLAPGAGAAFSNSYTVPLDSCGPYADRLAARGQDICSGALVQDTDSVSCPGTNSPAIDVTVSCPTTNALPGQPVTVSGTVTNTGNVTLNNVTVTNLLTGMRLVGPTSLAPGAGAIFSETFVPATDPIVASVTASGFDNCFGREVTDNAQSPCACPTLVFGAVSDPTYRPPDKPPGRNQAIWMRGISTNLVFQPDPGTFTENSDGTAQLTGTVRSLTNANCGFVVNVTFTGRTSTTPPGSPFLELDPSAYIQNGGPIDPSTWYYYTDFSGTLTGFGCWDGAIISVVRYGPAFQIGAGASGKNLNYGASGWFTWTVVRQPISGTFSQTTGQGDFNLDLVVCPPSEIGDFVWHDQNRNGIQDPGEPGIPGVEVRFSNCVGQLLAVTNTDASGFYFFTNQPGIYKVTFILPLGFNFTTPNVGSNDAIDSDANPANGMSQCVTLNPGEVNHTIDAGLTDVCPTLVFGAFSDPTFRPDDKPPDRHQAIWMRGVSTNLVFAPDPGQFLENSDGTARLTGSTTSLTNSTSGFIVDVTFTGRTSNAPPGSPFLELDPRAYIQNGGPIDPSTWHYYREFTGTFTGFGIWEGAVIRVERYGPAFQVGAGANGKNLRYGASGWFTWTVVSHPLSGRFEETTGVGDFNLDLIVCPISEIGDFVWEDSNRNGIQDAGEPGIPGVEVRFADCTGQLLAVTNTDVAGFYSFTNQPGIYSVTFILPGGFVFTVQDAGSNDALDSDANPTNGMSHCVTLNPGEVNDTIDAGLVRLCPFPVVGAFSDPTYRPADKPPDRNQAIWIRGISTNLVFEPDPGTFIEFPDGTARLTGTVRSLTNTSSGFLVTVNLSGRRTTPPPGSPLLELVPGAYIENGGPIDPSTWYYYTSFTGTLTGFGVWNGAVVNVTRYGPAFQVGFGANGKNTRFGASAWFTWTVASHPLSGRFAETTGQGDFNLDFLDCPTSALGDLVWEDTIRNNIQDAGEPGVPGVQISLADCIGTVVATTQTDANGRYIFPAVNAGFYRVVVGLPVGFAFAAQDAGPNDDIDSDVNPATGSSACLNIGSGQTQLSVDAGIYRIPAPTLQAFEFAGQGQCRITLRGEPGRRYRIESSDDLVHWRTITTMQNVNGVLQFADPDANPAQSFYRLIAEP